MNVIDGQAGRVRYYSLIFYSLTINNILNIIILLILAGISISALSNQGLFGKAQDAKTKTGIASEREAVTLGYTDWKIAKTQGENANLEVAGATSITGNETDGWEITFESGRKYNINGDGTFGVLWTQNGDTITNADGVTLKVGDYVDYDSRVNANSSDLQYTSPSAKSGASSDHDFNAATYESAGFGWRVLGTKNGKLRLIAEEFVGPGAYSGTNRTYYTLQGQKGYINGIDELNKISAIFGHGKGAESATSITVEDVNAITGYDPTVAQYGKGKFEEYGNKVTYTRGSGTALSATSTNGNTWSGTMYGNTFNYYDKATKTFVPLASGSTDITNTRYNYSPSTLNDKKEEPTYGVNENGAYNVAYQMLFGKWTIDKTNYYNRTFTGTGTQPRYWLASGYASAYNYCASWGLFFVCAGDVHAYYYSEGGSLYISDGREDDWSFGVCPVVSLKSNTILEWNDTAKEWKIK